MMMSVEKLRGEAEIARDINYMKSFLLFFDSFCIGPPNLHHLISLEIRKPLQLVVHHCIKYTCTCRLLEQCWGFKHNIMFKAWYLRLQLSPEQLRWDCCGGERQFPYLAYSQQNNELEALGVRVGLGWVGASCHPFEVRIMNWTTFSQRPSVPKVAAAPDVFSTAVSQSTYLTSLKAEQAYDSSCRHCFIWK